MRYWPCGWPKRFYAEGRVPLLIFERVGVCNARQHRGMCPGVGLLLRHKKPQPIMRQCAQGKGTGYGFVKFQTKAITGLQTEGRHPCSIRGANPGPIEAGICEESDCGSWARSRPALLPSATRAPSKRWGVLTARPRPAGRGGKLYEREQNLHRT